MSCTIVASPFLLLFAIADAAIQVSMQEKEDRETDKEHLRDIVKKSLTEGHITKEEAKSISKEYSTVFMSEEVLMKTLDEHGFSDFENTDGKITCKIENFSLEFSRDSVDEPYSMKINCDLTCDESQLISDVDSEYAMNVQEETYLKIKERLEKKNLKISEEEILEDDSIMLTINLE